MALGVIRTPKRGNTAFLCSGSVLGRPLKRSRSPREAPENISNVSRGLEREDPEARAAKAEGKRGAPNQCRC